jgi:hypothetical protein
MQSEQINELAGALAKAQGQMKNAAMNRVNPHFKSKYADLSSVLDAIRAPLSANGLSIVQTMQTGERAITLRTTLLHSSGQFIDTEYPLPLSLKPHEMGSALTYGRRYSVAALICNASDEDDDGAEAMKAKPTNGHAHDDAVTQEQADAIRELLEVSGKPVATLLKKAGAESVSTIAASKYQNCIAWLQS